MGATCQLSSGAREVSNDDSREVTRRDDSTRARRRGDGHVTSFSSISISILSDACSRHDESPASHSHPVIQSSRIQGLKCEGEGEGEGELLSDDSPPLAPRLLRAHSGTPFDLTRMR